MCLCGCLVFAFTLTGCVCLDSLRFLALGDWGGIPIYPYYLPAEKGVGERMGAIAEAYQTSFTLALGDNFYYHGVKDVEDKRFFETFEQVFDAKSLYTPWYVLAGNHDHRGNISAQLAYTNISKRWIFPYNYYTFTYIIGGGLTVDFIMLDTILLCGNTESDFVEGQPQGPASVKAAKLQWTWLEQQLSSSTADYLLVAGHFPVYSIGMHGPTDCLVERLDPLLYKYEVTAYLSGHDHNLQHLETTNGNTKVNHFVIGAATLINDCTKHRDAVPSGSSKFHWGGLFTLGGFAYFEATPDNMTVIFIHGNKKRLYETVLFPRKLK